MYAFASNDYMYDIEIGLTLSYLSYFKAESILGQENAHL
jgi:hypothetical protein